MNIITTDKIVNVCNKLLNKIKVNMVGKKMKTSRIIFNSRDINYDLVDSG